MDAIDQQRRKLLIRALSSGLFAAGSAAIPLPAWAMSMLPHLEPGKSIYKLSGKVTVDKKIATLDTKISAGSTIETGTDSKVIFAVGKDAFILRDNSRLELKGSDLIIQELRIITGKLLSVFGKRSNQQKLRMNTVTATVGIRGTGVYVESEPDKTYLCTCYGTTELASNTDPQSKEKIITRHHESPRYILKDAPSGKKIQTAEVINHTDDELDLIEALVGRATPFLDDPY